MFCLKILPEYLHFSGICDRFCSCFRQQFLSCPHGTTFSIPRGICVPEPENGRLLDEERKSCPPGTVLSLSNGVCVPDPAKEKKRLTCPPGTVYHLTEGTCVPDPVMYDVSSSLPKQMWWPLH